MKDKKELSNIEFFFYELLTSKEFMKVLDEVKS